MIASLGPHEFSDPVEDEHSGVAASTIAAVKYLIRENDPARLHAFLAKHSAGERADIEKYFRGKGSRK